jgi:hypothetical protein
MKKRSIKVEVVETADGRFIVRTYGDGTVEREPVVRLPRKTRYPPRPYWEWKFDREED